MPPSAGETVSDGAREFLSAIERPLQYLKAGDEKRIQTVRNLSKHVLDVTQKALDTRLSEPEIEVFRSLQDLFQPYEELGETEKRSVIERALAIISPKSQSVNRSAFRPEDHPSVNLEHLKELQKRLGGDVQFIKGVGPAVAQKLARAQIHTVSDLLLLFPTRYEDRRTVTAIRNLEEGVKATVVGTVAFAGVAFYRGLRRRVFEVVLEDGTGSLKLKWFHFYVGTIDTQIKRGQRLIVCGKTSRYRNQMEMHHPDHEVHTGAMDSITFGRVVPVYREVGGLYQKTIRKILHHAVTHYARDRVCLLPSAICNKLELLPPWRAILELHEPKAVPPIDHRTDPLRTLAFEELFFYCLSLALRKKAIVDRPGISFSEATPRYDQLKATLPFELTQAQQTVLETIRKDMASSKPMNRLLQGDVGSGKTIVAFLAGLVAIDHGYQVAFMAPTEILAEQHERTLQDLGSKVGVRVRSLLGRHTAAEKKEILGALAEGKVDLLVGTHALLEGGVHFASLGLIVVDEQHRFGVRQRAVIRSKGKEPDVLVMSATPIPRTLALTLYGDLDVSILNQLPRGRKPIETRIFQERDRKKVYDLVREELSRGRQVYIVYPLVDSSDRIELKDATSMAQSLKKDIFPEFRVALIHGQLPSAEKERIMTAFGRKEIDLLVSTTVIEVGIDVPNATIMVIEHPERFGLSQLHQLRGRVGRGSEKSSCLLIRPPRITQLAKERLEIFARLNDGFLLAEEDLRLRGPGDFFGVAQSGFPTFTVAVFPRDLDLLESSRREAFQLLDRDPDLRAPEVRHLRWFIENVWQERLNLVRVG